MDSISPISAIFVFFFGILIFFVSIVWLIFPFIVMNRMRGISNEIANSNRSTLTLIQEMAKSNQFLSKIAASTVQKTAPPQTAGKAPKLTISKDGENLGVMDATVVNTMLKRGELTLQDHYFDTVSNEWMTLDCHPDFC